MDIKPSSEGRILVTASLRDLHRPGFAPGTVGCRSPATVLPFISMLFKSSDGGEAGSCRGDGLGWLPPHCDRPAHRLVPWAPCPIPSIQGGNDAPCQERKTPAAPLHISCIKPCRNRSPLLQPCLQNQVLKRTAPGSRNTFFCQLDYMANDPAQAGCTTRRKLSQRWQKQRSHGEISHCFPSSHWLLMRSKKTEIIRSSGANVYLY